MSDKTINQHLIASLQKALDTLPSVTVTFGTKKGNERVMRCSRLLSAIPQHLQDGIADFRINGESIIGVYDFQNAAWRSFRKDSVISYELS